MEIIKVRSAPFGNRQSAVFKTILILFLKQRCSRAGGSSRIKKSKIKKNELALQEIPKSLLLLFIYEYTLNKPIGWNDAILKDSLAQLSVDIVFELEIPGSIPSTGHFWSMQLQNWFRFGLVGCFGRDWLLPSQVMTYCQAVKYSSTMLYSNQSFEQWFVHLFISHNV